MLGREGCRSFSLHRTYFIGAKVAFESLKMGQRFKAADELHGPGRNSEAQIKGKEKDLVYFSLIHFHDLFILEMLPLVWSLVPEQGLWHELYLWSFQFFFPLISPSPLSHYCMETADRSTIACCQYRLQKSISSQTGSEIGGGSYRFLWLFLVSFSELGWFSLVRYYFQLGWDKHIPGYTRCFLQSPHFQRNPDWYL